MEKKIINEVNRILELIGGNRTLLRESAPVTFFKKIYNMSDDIINMFMRKSDSEVDNAINVIRNSNSNTSSYIIDDAVEVLIRNIDFSKLAKIMLDNKSLGSQWDLQVDSLVSYLKDNPSKKMDVLNSLDNLIDNLPMLSDAPDELMIELKNQTKNKIESKLSRVGISVADEEFLKMYDEEALKRAKKWFKNYNQAEINSLLTKYRSGDRNFTSSELELIEDFIDRLGGRQFLTWWNKQSTRSKALWIFSVLYGPNAIYLIFKNREEIPDRFMSLIPLIGPIYAEKYSDKLDEGKIIQDAETWLKNNGYWSEGMTFEIQGQGVLWKLPDGTKGFIQKQSDGSWK